MSAIPRSTRASLAIVVPLPRAGVVGPRRLLERAQSREVFRWGTAAVVHREFDGPIAEALERLAQPPHPDRALAPHLVEVDLDRDQLLGGARLVEHVAVRADDHRAPVAAAADAVDVEYET